MTENRMQEIQASCNDAQYGYGAPTTQKYAKDVGDLLKEIDQLQQELIHRVEEMAMLKVQLFDAQHPQGPTLCREGEYGEDPLD